MKSSTRKKYESLSQPLAYISIRKTISLTTPVPPARGSREKPLSLGDFLRHYRAHAMHVLSQAETQTLTGCQANFVIDAPHVSCHAIPSTVHMSIFESIF